MSISSYTELQSAAANWLDDTSLSSRVLEFITLGEAKINRRVKKARMAWSNTTLTGSTSSRSLTLPSDFVESAALFLTTFSVQTKLTPVVDGAMEFRTVTGTPVAWAINGANIDLDCLCDQAHTFLFRYRAAWNIASTTTNWLLTNYPDIYLAAVMTEAFDFRRNFDETVRWQGKFEQAVEELEENEARAGNLAPLLTEFPHIVRRGGTFNYSTGL